MNVSHGCVNMAPADAQTCDQIENPGDPVMITGRPAAGTWENGWTVWFLSWKELVRGSALGMAVQGGPGRQHVHQPVLGRAVHSVLPAADREAP